MTAQGTLPLPAARPRAHQLVGLRDYQEAALAAVDEHRARGANHVVLSMATGAGKTVTAAHLIDRALQSYAQRVLFLVHRDELVDQSVRTLSTVNPDLLVGVVKAERDDVWAQVMVASAQTIERPARFARLQAAIGDAPLLIVSDECHHDGPRTNRAARISTLDPVQLVGLTATPNRGDKAGLEHLYSDIAFHIGILDLIALGHLAPMRGLAVDTETDLDDVRVVAGELVEKDLAHAVDTPARNRLIVEAWQRHASDRKRTVAFCVDTAHARHVADAFNEAGIKAGVILGTTPSEERQAILAALHDGSLPVLANCMVLSEGYDEPGIDCILMARPTKSGALYIQCAGRGARRAQGKADCLVIDFVDNSARHSLVQFPVLAGAETRPAGAPQDTHARQMRLGPVDLLDVHEARVKAERHVNLFSSSSYVWRDVEGYMVAPADRATWAVLFPKGDQYVPGVITWPDTRHGAPHGARLFDRPLDLEMAMAVAEQRIAAQHTGARWVNMRDAHWRAKAAAPTEKQLRHAARWGAIVPPGATRDQVADAIDDAMVRVALVRLARPQQHTEDMA